MLLLPAPDTPTIQSVLDLDGVSYSFTHALGNEAARVTGRDRREFPPARTWNFPMDEWGFELPEFLDLMKSGWQARELFWKGEPLPGAPEGWNKLQNTAGVYIHVVTDRPVDVDGAATRHWLETHGFGYHQLTITADKVDAVASLAETLGTNRTFTIDDRDSNHLGYVDVGFDAYLMRQPWNTHVVDTPHVRDLNEFADVVAVAASDEAAGAAA